MKRKTVVIECREDQHGHAMKYTYKGELEVKFDDSWVHILDVKSGDKEVYNKDAVIRISICDDV